MDDCNERLRDAAARGDLDALAACLAAGADPNAQLHGSTPLIAAAYCGQDACIRALLAAGARPDEADSGGLTALMIVAAISHTASIAALLAAGANPAVPGAASRPQPRRIGTPLDVAAMSGQVQVLRQLLTALSAEAQARMAGEQPHVLALALSRRNRPAAQCLLEEGPSWPAQVVLAQLRMHSGAFVLPLYASLVTRQPLTAQQWHRLPSPCPGLGAVLPLVLQRSVGEAALLVQHMAPAGRERLRTAALCLGRAQRVHALPTPIVWRILALAAAEPST